MLSKNSSSISLPTILLTLAPAQTYLLIFREITVKGVLGVDYAAFAKAIKVIESGRYPLEKMATHTFSLAEAETAILTLAGEVGEGGICIAIDPHKA